MYKVEFFANVVIKINSNLKCNLFVFFSLLKSTVSFLHQVEHCNDLISFAWFFLAQLSWLSMHMFWQLV